MIAYPKSHLFTLILITSFYCITDKVFCQNLVPNPSFEDTISCPNNYGEIFKAAGWESFRFSPDYFHICNSNVVGVPSNDFGFQLPRTGNAYAGFISYRNYQFYREFLGIQLTQQLIVGQKYFISFYVSMAVNDLNSIKIATDNLGVRFSTIQYTMNSPAPVDNYSQVFTNIIIQDTTNWIRISGDFVADSAYNYVGIGNYFTDSATNSINTDTSTASAYYFVEDICVSNDSLDCIAHINYVNINKSNNFIIYPNPTKDKVIVENISEEEVLIELYNSIGKLIISKNIGISCSNIDMSNYSRGVYYILIKSKRSSILLKNNRIIKL